jgi:hypothetical protein
LHTVRALDESTWDLFADLVERNGGIYGGCWCIAYHPRRPEGLTNREAKHQTVRRVFGAASRAAGARRRTGESSGIMIPGRGEGV